MRAITLTQPWATLVALEAKRVETRGFPTRYRGRFVVAAAKDFPRRARELCNAEPFLSTLLAGGFGVEADIPFVDTAKLPTASAVCTARLVACFPTERVVGRADYVGRPEWQEPGDTLYVDETELAFGDYSPGRFAWLLDDAHELRPPVPVRGRQGWWDLPDAELR